MKRENPDGGIPTPSELAHWHYEGTEGVVPIGYYARRGMYKYVTPSPIEVVELNFDPDIYTLQKHMTPIEHRLVEELYARHLDGSERTLEIGTGAGNLLDYMRLAKGHRGEMIGIDLNPNMFALNIVNISHNFSGSTRETDVSLQAGNGEHLEFPNKSFRLVMIGNMLYHTDNPLAVIQEAFRVLADDGILVVSTRGPNNMRQAWEWEQSVGRALSNEPEYAGMISPVSFYNHFGIKDTRKALGKQGKIISSFYETAPSHYSLAVPDSGWPDLRNLLIYMVKDDFMVWEEEKGCYVRKSPSGGRLSKFVDQAAKSRFDQEVNKKGYYEMDVEEVYFIVEKKSKGDLDQALLRQIGDSGMQEAQPTI